MTDKTKISKKQSKSTSPTKTQPKKDNPDGFDDQDVVIRDKDDDKRYFCTLCQSSGLWHNRQGHINTKGHKEAQAEQILKKSKEGLSRDIIEPENPQNNVVQDTSNLIETLTPETKAELDLSYSRFILQYRLPFNLVSPINTFTKQICRTYSNNVLKDYKVSRKTVTGASQVVSKTLKEDLHNALLTSPFSLSVDCTSDSHGNEFFAICARYLEEDNVNRPVTKLLSVLPLTTSFTGETLYTKIMEEILYDDEIRSNFVGIVTDDGGNMTGCNVGISTRLKKVFQHIIDMKDISHGLHNVFKKAYEMINLDIRNIVTGISSHFHSSSKASGLLKETLIAINMEPLEILHQSMTRFLSMRNCIQRLLDLWPGLLNYFSKYGNKTHKSYFTPENEIHLRVLSLLVNNVVDMNEYFQDDDLLYNEVFEKIKHGYVTMANIILKKAKRTMDFDQIYAIAFEKLKKDDIIAGKFNTELAELLVTGKEFEEQFLSEYESLNILLTQIDQGQKEQLALFSIKFIIMCLKQSKKRLPYSIKIMNLSQAVFFEEKYDKDKWLALKTQFPNILKSKKQKDDFATEVRNMEYSYNKIKEKIDKTDKASLLKVWKNESITYPNMYLVARAIFVLPYSSMAVERVFSALKDIKNKKRNRLTTENVEACLLGHQATRSEKFVITEAMIENYLNPNFLAKTPPNNIKTVPSASPATSTTARVPASDAETTSANSPITSADVQNAIEGVQAACIKPQPVSLDNSTLQTIAQTAIERSGISNNNTNSIMVPEIGRDQIKSESQASDEDDDDETEKMIVQFEVNTNNPLKRYASRKTEEGKI